MLPLKVRVMLGVMAMKEYSTLPRDPEGQSHDEMQLSVKYLGHPFLGGNVLTLLLGEIAPQTPADRPWLNIVWYFYHMSIFTSLFLIYAHKNSTLI